MRIEEAIKQKSFGSEQNKMIINLIYTGNWILNINGRVLKPFGLTTQQYNVLRILKGQYPDPAPVSLLNDRMLDQMSNASRLVEKLRQKGYVDRTTCPNDRRQVDVKLTSSGLQILQSANEAMRNAAEKKFNVLDDEEARQLNELLDKLRSSGKNIE